MINEVIEPQKLIGKIVTRNIKIYKKLMGGRSMNKALAIWDLPNLKLSSLEKYSKDPDLYEISNKLSKIRNVTIKKAVGYYLAPQNYSPDKFNRFLDAVAWLGLDVKIIKKDNCNCYLSQISLDVLDAIDCFETFIIVSGNGKLVNLVKYLRFLNKEVIVVSFRHSLSCSLKNICNHQINIDEEPKISDRIVVIQKQVS